MLNQKEFRVIELFSGIGGFRLGIEEATKGKWKIIWANDIDKYAVQTYNKNFKTNYKPTDITTVKPKDVPDHDLICAGFPCQSFSIAGKRKGLEDTRGTLFFDIVRIAKHHRTPYLFLENVKGLLNHDEGNTFRVILQTLDELGYDVQWQVLNSKCFGVPQNRERVFIIGHLRGEPRPEVFPIRESSKKTMERRSRIPQQTSPTVTAHQYKITRGMPMILPVLTPDRMNKRQHGRRFKEDGEPAFILTGQDKDGVYDGMKIRRLTPVECERLQGFEDNFTEGVSDTQRYKMIGNAVTVNVIRAIVWRWVCN